MFAEIVVTKTSLLKRPGIARQLMQLSIRMEDREDCRVFFTAIDTRHITRLLDILDLPYGLRMHAPG